MTQPRITLICDHGDCAWEPGQELTLGLVQTHYETEHPESYAEDPNALQMKMIIVCPRCGADLGKPTHTTVTASGKMRETYDCYSCVRSYTLRRAPGD